VERIKVQPSEDVRVMIEAADMDAALHEVIATGAIDE
jgi:hypothetical protein